jgi:excisionase family DNA binding protein
MIDDLFFEIGLRGQARPEPFHFERAHLPKVMGLYGLATISQLALTVKQAAKYLGVSPQTVYLWVERKQIPHLRVMGRNIRFLKSDLEPFRASFKQEMRNG